MRRYAREQHEYRALGFNELDGEERIAFKGPWRSKKKDAMADGRALVKSADRIVVQKVRLGITSILETTIIK